MKSDPVQTNIRTYITEYVLSYFFIPIAIWPLVWGQYMNFSQVGLILSIGFIFDTAFQLPSGALADMFGRKPIIIFSKILFIVSLLFFIIANNFWFFLVAQILDSIGGSFYSGSASALMYDSLKEHNKENLYQKLESKGYLYATIGFIAASILGGYLYTLNYRLPYIALMIPCILGFFNAFMYNESHFRPEGSRSLNQYLQLNKEGFMHIFRNKKISLISLYSLITSFIFYAGLWLLYQKAANEFGFKPQMVGIIIAALYACRAIGTWIFPKIIIKCEEFNFAIILSTMQGLSSFLVWVPILPIALTGLVLRYMSDGFRQPFLAKLQHDQIESQYRATSLSALALLVYFVLALTNPIMGRGVDIFGARSVIAITGILPLLIGIPTVLYIKKVAQKRSDC